MVAEGARPHAEVYVALAGRKDLSGEIYRQLRRAILAERLRPGDALPPTRELGRQLGISRTTVGVAYDRAPTLADALLDRLVHNAHRIELRGDSLRRPRDGVLHDETGAVTTPAEAGQ